MALPRTISKNFLFAESFKHATCQQIKVKLLAKNQNVVLRRSIHTKERSIMDKESYLNKRIVKGKISFLGKAMLAFPIITAGLGAWQVYRKHWKDSLVLAMETKLKLPPIDLPKDLTDRKSLEYRQIRVKGRFDHSGEMYVGPRSRLDIENKNKTFLFTGDEKGDNMGYFVITPFILSDREDDSRILVNRGWVHTYKVDPNTRLEGQIEDEIELVGILRLQEDRPPFCQRRREDNRMFTYRDLVSMATMENTNFVFLDMLREYTVPGGPIGGQTRVTLRNRHQEYIITWFSMSALTLYIWYRTFYRIKI